jgi:hypothetical protein
MVDAEINPIDVNSSEEDIEAHSFVLENVDQAQKKQRISNDA